MTLANCSDVIGLFDKGLQFSIKSKPAEKTIYGLSIPILRPIPVWIPLRVPRPRPRPRPMMMPISDRPKPKFEPKPKVPKFRFV